MKKNDEHWAHHAIAISAIISFLIVFLSYLVFGNWRLEKTDDDEFRHLQGTEIFDLASPKTGDDD